MSPRGRSFVPSVAFVAWVVAATAWGQAPPAPTGAARDVPSSVANAIRTAYPAATITSASQERVDGRIAFRVECMDLGRRRVLTYDAVATLIESSEQVDEKDVPAPVLATVTSFKRAKFAWAMKVTRGTLVQQYEVYVRGTRKNQMVIKPDGTLVSYR